MAGECSGPRGVGFISHTVYHQVRSSARWLKQRKGFAICLQVARKFIEYDNARPIGDIKSRPTFRQDEKAARCDESGIRESVTHTIQLPAGQIKGVIT